MSASLTVGQNSEVKWCLPRGYQTAQTVTVAVNVRLQNAQDINNAAIDLSDVFATISWSAQDCDARNCPPDCQSMDFDCVGGSAITVEATALTVIVHYPGAPGANHPPLFVDVSVGIGTSGKAGMNPSAQRTIKVGTILAGATSPVQPIPQWAVGATLVNTNLAAPVATMTQLTASNAGIVVSVESMGKIEDLSVIIKRGLGARDFQLTIPAGADSTNTAVVFDLCPN